MAYSKQMQDGNLYSYYFAPRGNRRMADLGMQLSQMYLSPFDHIIGIIGDAGAGKSLLIKGMFPGVDLTNDDEGVNIRPLPLLHEIWKIRLLRIRIIWIFALSLHLHRCTCLRKRF